MHPQIIQLSQQQEILEVVPQIVSTLPSNPHGMIIIEPSGSSITIEQIRELRRDLQLVGKANRTILFHSFEKATIEAQNAMLKMLEELSTTHMFLLFTTRIDAILPTIRSRCTVNTHFEVKEELKANTQILEIISSIRKGQGLAEMSHPLMQPTSLDDARNLLKLIITALHAQLKTGDPWVSASLRKALELLSLSERNNINAQLSIDLWLLDASRRK